MITHVSDFTYSEQQGQGGNPFGGFGFPGGFPGGFGGINIEDLLRQQMGGGGGRQAGGGQRTFTFTFGGGGPGQGMRFEF